MAFLKLYYKVILGNNYQDIIIHGYELCTNDKKYQTFRMTVSNTI